MCQCCDIYVMSWVCQFSDVSCCCLQEQASWVCQCNDAVVHQLEQDFKKTLQQQNSLEQWADWLEGVVNQVLKAHEGSADFPKAARQFLLKWSFYRWVLSIWCLAPTERQSACNCKHPFIVCMCLSNKIVSILQVQICAE